MKKLLAFSLVLALCTPFLPAQDFPEPMQPPRLVNDFTNLLGKSEAESLEGKLLDFNNRTSTQIYVVTVPTLNGYEPNQYTTQLAEKWKIGVKGKDNGVLILVKPKTAEEKGQVYIAVGYGLEGVLTDLQANQIVDLEMIPRFRQNDFAGGIEVATNVIMKIAAGEFTADQYLDKKGSSKKSNPILGLIIMAILLSVIFGGRSKMNRHNSLGSNLPLLFLLGMMGRGNGGSFGGFSSGGGFGGGGGGSFGGGGAGGSW